MTNYFERVNALIDAANALDPNLEEDNGQQISKELLYSQRMTSMLEAFDTSASEALKIAARAQHIERWRSPRSDYPEGRTGYKKWRANLGLFHAQRTAELMEEAGYDADSIDRVKYLVQKRGIKRDAESQCLEDVICLVFLQYYLDDFATKHDEAKLIDIIQKTWAKMSEQGHSAALKLNYQAAMLELIQKALS
ncbi:DUF4202 domain-containing protein [Agaribacterium sp. ZY112]|uniref:DUF4202 domain-containing protein n=1 Tax=Agaribacterium sp. ZY112 TaxID=3233574 RepID=UPI0035261C16